ncbi:MAG: FHA domain-containing protein [Nitrospiraceae bacterium]
MSKLVLKYNEITLKEFVLDHQAITIGRNSNNDLVIDHPAVSGRHARISAQDGNWVFEDLKSTNGTFFNNGMIYERVLNHGDQVIIGGHMLIFQNDGLDVHAPIVQAECEQTMMLNARKHHEMIQAIQSRMPEKVGWLYVLKGKTDREAYKLAGPLFSIGSDSTANIKLRNWFAPEQAALLSRSGAGYAVKSLIGRKPILVNGEPHQSDHELRNGDTLSVAGVLFQFYLKDREG